MCRGCERVILDIYCRLPLSLEQIGLRISSGRCNDARMNFKDGGPWKSGFMQLKPITNVAGKTVDTWVFVPGS